MLLFTFLHFLLPNLISEINFIFLLKILSHLSWQSQLTSSISSLTHVMTSFPLILMTRRPRAARPFAPFRFQCLSLFFLLASDFLRLFINRYFFFSLRFPVLSVTSSEWRHRCIFCCFFILRFHPLSCLLVATLSSSLSPTAPSAGDLLLLFLLVNTFFLLSDGEKK